MSPLEKEIQALIKDNLELFEALNPASPMHQYKTDQYGNILEIKTKWNDGTETIEKRN